jgi:alkanesulfonate monooxygenase
MGPHFIGMVSHRAQSEIHPPAPGVAMDPGYLAHFAQVHEAAGFDRILIAWSSSQPDATLVAAHAAAATQRIGLMVAHRPGFVAPSLAARAFATLDHLSGGRAAVHVISGGSPADQQADGDFVDHDARYARTDEYMAVMRRVWTAAAPFDHDGKHYRLRRAFAEIRCVQAPHIPIFFGGSSDAAIAVAGRHADVYAFWGETLDQARETIARVRESTAAAGRDPGAVRFSISFRPILGDTESAAWDRARAILARVLELRGGRAATGNARVESAGSARLLEAAAGGAVRDKRLWTEVAAAIGAGHNSTALVGTADQVADTLADYWAIGVSTFLIRGFDPLEDAAAYGRSLLPATRAAIAARVARAAA